MEASTRSVVREQPRNKRTIAIGKERHQSHEEDEGYIKRFFCVTLRLRVLGYIIQQPPSFLFICSLLAIGSVLPFIAVYIQNNKLPDIDNMRLWNSFIGQLNKETFCVQSKIAEEFSQPQPDQLSVCVGIPYVVHVPHGINVSCAGECMFNILLNGSELQTRIFDSWTGERIDENIAVSVTIPFKSGGENDTKVNATVQISAPENATSVYGSFQSMFSNQNNWHKDLFYYCSSQVSKNAKKHLLLRSTDKTRPNCTVQPVGEIYRHQGLITIYLSSEDRSLAALRIKLSVILVVGVVLAFIIAIGCTDRPSKPKPSQS